MENIKLWLNSNEENELPYSSPLDYNKKGELYDDECGELNSIFKTFNKEYLKARRIRAKNNHEAHVKLREEQIEDFQKTPKQKWNRLNGETFKIGYLILEVRYINFYNAEMSCSIYANINDMKHYVCIEYFPIYEKDIDHWYIRCNGHCVNFTFH